MWRSCVPGSCLDVIPAIWRLFDFDVNHMIANGCKIVLHQKADADSLLSEGE
jgi:hypothetical protein